MHPQPAKSLSDKQIEEIKRVYSGSTTSESGLCWAYGITVTQLKQVLNQGEPVPYRGPGNES